MRFRPHCSRAFWFGLPGLVFLLWGWGMSMSYYSRAGFAGARSWVVGQAAGEVYLCWDTDGWPDWRSFNARNLEMSLDEARKVKGRMISLREVRPSHRFVFMPAYWLAIVYMAMWTGLLIWRRRKFRNAIPAESSN